MRALLLLLIFFCFISTITHSQNLNYRKFKPAILSDRLFHQLNQVRDSLGLVKLKKNKALTKAAQNQVKHIAEKDKLIPFQMKRSMKTPSLRVNHFEGNFKRVGEINAAFNTNIEKFNYKTVADSIVRSWINDNSHYKNIKDRFLQKIGIASIWDKKANKIYVVATFGNPDYQLEVDIPDNLYNIKDPEPKKYRKCGEFLRKFNQKPPDVRHSLRVVEDKIFFYFNDLYWFKKLFTESKDGIAVDIITRSQFPCDEPNKLAKSWKHRGQILKPVYRDELLKNNRMKKHNELLAPVGKLPDKFQDNTVEFNIMLLKNQYECYYNTFYNLVHHKWALLNMGLFKDTLSADNPVEEAAISGEAYRFVIPFKKNKYHYDPKDIKPLYDSLRLNNYNIKHITIRAYASVEGPVSHNRMLQRKRAESIVKALQNFQIDTIDKTITTAENWVEFMDDIENTSYSYLKNKPQHKIKHKLNKENLKKEMEFILKDHRKAVILIKLEKKLKYHKKTPHELKNLFNASLKNGDTDKALKIQKAIFSKIKDKKIPAHFLDSIGIPKKASNNTLINNQIAFKFEQKHDSLQEAINKYKELRSLLPGKNPKIQYNISVLRLKQWKKNKYAINKNELFQDLVELKNKTSINKKLVKRLIINFYIIASEYLLQEKKYSQKNQAMKYIYKNYKDLDHSQKDILNIAKYFAAFNKFKWAIRLLTPYVKKIDVNEDLVFYYLNLTIIKNQYNTDPSYRKILINAYNINHSRFCHLFDQIGKGITFQLLDKKYLKEIYCENCYGFQY